MKLKATVLKVRRVRNFKATDAEWALIRKKADKYSQGNISEWIRYSSSELDPRSGDIIKTKKTA